MSSVLSPEPGYAAAAATGKKKEKLNGFGKLFLAAAAAVTDGF